MEIHISIIGILMILLSVIHVGFPQYFKWKVELNHLSLINRQMFLIHTLFLAVILLLMGLLCVICSHDIINTKLGNYLALGFAIFWGLRLIMQFFGYSSTLWRGKKFETGIHVLFSILWIYFTFTFSYIYWLGYY